MDLQLQISERYLRFVQFVAVVYVHLSVMQWLVVFCVTNAASVCMCPRGLPRRVVGMFCLLTVVIDYSEHLLIELITELIDRFD